MFGGYIKFILLCLFCGIYFLYGVSKNVVFFFYVVLSVILLLVFLFISLFNRILVFGCNFVYVFIIVMGVLSKKGMNLVSVGKIFFFSRNFVNYLNLLSLVGY